jgi:hypothetical protein
MRSTSSAGASDSGIGRCWGGVPSDLERLTSAAGTGGSAAGGRVSAIPRTVVEEELGSSSIDATVVSPRRYCSGTISDNDARDVVEISSCLSHASFAWRRELGWT